MPRLSLRPHTFTLGLPGNSNATAHAGPPASDQHSHTKLPSLDPLVARNEVLAREAAPQARAPSRQAPASKPSPPPPRRQLDLLLRGAARAMGIRRGEPVARSALLRYQGTPLRNDAAKAHDASRNPDDLALFVADLAALMQAEQSALDARIAIHEAACADELVLHHLARTDADLARSSRRASHLSDQAHALAQQRLATAAELASLQDEIASSTALLSATREPLARTLDALAAEEAGIARLQALHHAATAGRLSLREAMQRDDLTQQQEQEMVQRQERKARLAEGAELLKTLEAQESRSLSALQARARNLAQQQQTLETKISSLTRLGAGAVSQDVWSQSEEAERLREQQEPLRQAVQSREQEQALAASQAEQAAQAHTALTEQACQALLNRCGGFDPSGNLKPLQEAMTAWDATLSARLARAGDQALPRNLALNIAFEALALAAGGDALRAAELMHELQGLTLSSLVPPASGAVAAAAHPSEAARQLAGLLSSEPSGIQMLELLLPPSPTPLGSAQAEAWRLYLQVAHKLHSHPDLAPAQRDWWVSAQRAARTVVHAAHPTQALAQCPPAERAAYRALKNGYDSPLPGSRYDRANQHLKKLAHWLKAHTAASHRPSMLAPANPLNSLREGLTVAAATALPTPARRAAKALQEAAAHLNDLLASRHAHRPAGQMPSPGELAWQAIAYQVQWHAEDADLTTMKLDAEFLREIRQRCQELQQQFRQELSARTGGPETASGFDPALDSSWKELQTAGLTLPQALALLLQRMPADSPAPRDAQDPMAEAAAPLAREAALRQQLHASVAQASRLLQDGDPAGLQSGRDLFALTRDMIENLEWRDRLRLVGQKVWGLNAGPLSAAVAAGSLPTGVGLKLTAGVQHNDDQVMEIYMGRTGLYLQLGEQVSWQQQGGVGLNLGYAWGLGDEENGARVGIGGSAEWKARRDTSLEQGVQLRVLRLSKGKDPELMAAFLDMYEHLMTLVDRELADGQEACDDWMHELLAHHDNLNIGLIDNAQRDNIGTETSASLFAGLRLGQVDDKPRRVNLSLSAGLKARQDQSHSQTEVAGYMSTRYRDSSAQTRVEAQVRAGASVMLHQWSETDANTGKPKPKASLSAAGLDLGYATEIHAAGVTRFCTLFTIDKKVDPTRSDCAMDFQQFEDFEAEVRREWKAWVHYGTAKLPEDMSEGMRYAVAERQLENLLDQGRLFAQHNRFATMYVDKALKAKAAPMLDGLRTLAGLQRKAQREEAARQSDRLFDDLIAHPALWEPTILMLREKTRLQVERGLDFIGKLQNNRIAESMRTVGQWPLYEPVLRAEAGQQPTPPGHWRGPTPEARMEDG